MKEMWNERYAQESYIYGTAPNEFFKRQIDRLTPGRLLLPAEGEGRNAVYAASRGWEVVACDYSEAGKKKAMQLAERKGVAISYEVGDFGKMELEPESFDAAGLLFAHFTADFRPAYHRKVVEALKPGGWIILEAFSKSQLGRNSGGPKDLATLISKTELQNEFNGLSGLEITEEEVALSEGDYHCGMASVVRMLGRK